MADGGLQIYETEVEHADGSRHHVTFYKTLVFGENGEARGIAGSMVDITDRKILEENLREAAEHDFLTGLFNRRQFLKIAEQRIAAGRESGKPTFVAIADIDRFKRFNDGHGHACGDAVLRHVSALLSNALGPDHLLARCGGEEFYVMLDCESDTQAEEILNAVRLRLAGAPLDWNGEELRVTVSFGVASLVTGEDDVLAVLSRADEALYAAKHCGRNRVERADPVMEQPNRDAPAVLACSRPSQSISRASEASMIGMPSRIGKASLAAFDTNSLLLRS